MEDIQKRIEAGKVGTQYTKDNLGYGLSSKSVFVHLDKQEAIIQELTAREEKLVEALNGMFDNTEWINGKMDIGIPSFESFKKADALLEDK